MIWSGNISSGLFTQQFYTTVDVCGRGLFKGHLVEGKVLAIFFQAPYWSVSERGASFRAFPPIRLANVAVTVPSKRLPLWLPPTGCVRACACARGFGRERRLQPGGAESAATTKWEPPPRSVLWRLSKLDNGAWFRKKERGTTGLSCWECVCFLTCLT